MEFNILFYAVSSINTSESTGLIARGGGGGGGTLGIFGWGCAAGTLEPLAYTRTSLAEFCYSILE